MDRLFGMMSDVCIVDRHGLACRAYLVGIILGSVRLLPDLGKTNGAHFLRLLRPAVGRVCFPERGEAASALEPHAGRHVISWMLLRDLL